MKKTFTAQKAQIGIAAVLLTTILLAIGVSVSTRVARQVAQETERTESTQSLNTAESSVDIVAGGNEAGNTNTGNLSNQVATTSMVGENSIYLNAGETLAIPLSEAMPTISWELKNAVCNQETSPSLLLSHYVNGTVNYYPINTSTCTESGNRTGYIKSNSSSDIKYQNEYSNPTIAGGTLRVKALYSGTYVKMDGLVTISRAAADNAGGDQVRVAEQRQTKETAPSVMDYGLFVSNGSISKN